MQASVIRAETILLARLAVTLFRTELAARTSVMLCRAARRVPPSDRGCRARVSTPIVRLFNSVHGLEKSALYSGRPMINRLPSFGNRILRFRDGTFIERVKTDFQLFGIKIT
jgi:hypothetical protein